MENGPMPKITTFLTYNNQAEEAATFYVSVFERSRISPTILSELFGDTDPKKSKRAMNAMLKMKKIIIQDLTKACEG